MTLKPTVVIYFGHQTSQVSWFMRNDPGWKVLMDLPADSIHTAYLDGLNGRLLTGQYDALAALDGPLRRPDYQTYHEDVLEQLDAFVRRFGIGPDLGCGGFHSLGRWTDIIRNNTLQNTLFQCRKAVLQNDGPPSLNHPNKTDARTFVLDGMGNCLADSLAGVLCGVEEHSLPLSCEGCSGPGTFFAKSRRARPQYTMRGAVRNMTGQQWADLFSIGCTDQTILPDNSPPMTREEELRWTTLGLRIGTGPRQVAESIS